MSTITPELIRGLVSESDDFAFEMRILRTLRESAGHSLPSRVLHGGMYSDPIRGEPRQYDFSFEIGRGALAVRLAIECKNVFSLSPVVVCGCDRIAREARHDIIVWGRGVLERKETSRTGGISVTIPVRNSAVFPKSEFVGKSVGKLRPPKGPTKSGAINDGYALTNDSELYDPWSQAVAHAATIAKSAASRPREPVGDSVANPTFTICLPVVVVPDQTLWAVKYGESGEMEGEPTPVNQCDIYRDQRFTLVEQREFFQTFEVSHFRFCTESGLAKLVRRLAIPHSELWDEWFPESTLDADFRTGFPAIGR